MLGKTNIDEIILKIKQKEKEILAFMKINLKHRFFIFHFCLCFLNIYTTEKSQKIKPKRLLNEHRFKDFPTALLTFLVFVVFIDFIGIIDSIDFINFT